MNFFFQTAATKENTCYKIQIPQFNQKQNLHQNLNFKKTLPYRKVQMSEQNITQKIDFAN